MMGWIVALTLSVVFNVVVAYAMRRMKVRHEQEIRWIYLDWAVRFRLGEFSDMGIEEKTAEDMKKRMRVLIQESLKKVTYVRPMKHSGIKP